MAHPYENPPIKTFLESFKVYISLLISYSIIFEFILTSFTE